MSETPPPHALDLVIDFVNTLDVDADTDELSRPQDLAAWLRRRGLLRSTEGALTDSDHADAIDLREALRALMLANNGHGGHGDPWRALEQAARRGDLAIHFASDGTASLRPGTAGAAGAVARLLVPVADALADGSWRRVKACRAPGCRWAFYDRSRNRSGVWCEMAVCGNRTKVRTYRQNSARKRP